MEYTNEFLARVYGAYIGTECVYGINQEIGLVCGVDTFKQRVLISSVNPSAKYNTDWWDIREYESFPLSQYPLSAITDEHAIEVAKIVYGDGNGFFHKSIVGRDVVNAFIKGHDVLVTARNRQNVLDYLRSQGYDCGYGDIPSLIDAGIAINKNTLNK